MKYLILCLALVSVRPIFAEVSLPPELTANTEVTELAVPIVAEATGPEAPKVAAAKAEAEIPVQLEPARKVTAEGGVIYKALGSFAIICILGLGAYIFIGRYRRAQIGKSTAPEIKVLRQHYLGPKKSLAIIRVAGESILIGVTDHNINLIKSLALLDEDVPEVTPTNFESVFQQTEEPSEDFAISGIRDFVSNRLKNMRSLN